MKRNRIVVLALLAVVALTACNRGSNEVWPNGTKLFGKRTLKDGRVTIERAEYPTGERQFDVTIFPDGTFQISRAEFADGQKQFGATHKPDGTRTFVRIESADGEKRFDVTDLPDGTERIVRKETSDGIRRFDITYNRDGSAKIGRLEAPDGQRQFDITILPDKTYKCSRIEYPNGTKSFDYTHFPDGTEALGRKVHSDGTELRIEDGVSVPPDQPDYQLYMGGLDLQGAGDLNEAKATFGLITTKYSKSALVALAQQHISEIDAALLKQEQLKEQEGTTIDFTSLYAKTYGTGLQIGKRYRVRARVASDLTGLFEPVSGGHLIDCDHDFDSPAQLGEVMRSAVAKQNLSCLVVVSMGYNRRLHIHRAENCY